MSILASILKKLGREKTADEHRSHEIRRYIALHQKAAVGIERANPFTQADEDAILEIGAAHAKTPFAPLSPDHRLNLDQLIAKIKPDDAKHLTEKEQNELDAIATAIGFDTITMFFHAVLCIRCARLGKLRDRIAPLTAQIEESKTRSRKLGSPREHDLEFGRKRSEEIASAMAEHQANKKALAAARADGAADAKIVELETRLARSTATLTRMPAETAELKKQAAARYCADENKIRQERINLQRELNDAIAAAAQLAKLEQTHNNLFGGPSIDEAEATRRVEKRRRCLCWSADPLPPEYNTAGVRNVLFEALVQSPMDLAAISLEASSDMPADVFDALAAAMPSGSRNLQRVAYLRERGDKFPRTTGKASQMTVMLDDHVGRDRESRLNPAHYHFVPWKGQTIRQLEKLVLELKAAWDKSPANPAKNEIAGTREWANARRGTLQAR